MKIIAETTLGTKATLGIILTRNCFRKIMEVFAVGIVTSLMHEFFTYVIFGSQS
jgi:hypothetical protein